MKKLLFMLVGLLGVLVGAAAWFTHRTPSSSNGADEYKVAAVEFGTLIEPVSATGTIQPRDVLTVGAEAPGRVVEVAVDRNQTVCEGDVLLRLDDQLAQEKRKQAERGVAAARAQLDSAKATRDAAEKAFKKMQALPDTVGLKKELDAAQYQFVSAVAGVAAAENQLQAAEDGLEAAELIVKRHLVRVPYRVDAEGGADALPGVGALATSEPQGCPRRRYFVLDRKVSLNQEVAPPQSASLFTLAEDLAHVRIQAQVAEGDVGKVRGGMEATFTVSAYSEHEVRFAGRVAEVRWMPVNQHGVVYYEVVLEADNRKDPNGEWMLRPGMTASVDLTYRKKEGVWKMPVAALNLRLDESRLSAEARARLESGRKRYPGESWKTVWTLGADQKPWPVFVRVGKDGLEGLSDGEFQEVVDWESDLSAKPNPGDPSRVPPVIIHAPPVGKAGLFELPRVKL
jgi:HlyD family secretion protein